MRSGALFDLATMRVSNIDKDPRRSNSGSLMKLIQDILDFLAILVLKQLHAQKLWPAALKTEAQQFR
jgi:hypothetical protein